MTAAIVNVVEEMPCPAHGETTEKPTPTPNATINNVTAAAATAPARTAFQLTAECPSSSVRISVVVPMLIGPSLPARGMIHALQGYKSFGETKVPRYFSAGRDAPGA